MKTPYPKQLACINELVTMLRPPASGALNGSETGTGKTLCGVEVARRLSPPAVVVVCPKIVIPAWVATFEEQGVSVSSVINYEKLRTGRTALGSWIKNQFIWNLPKDSLVIWDEVQRGQGAFTKNSRMLIGAKLAGLKSLMLSATAAEDPTEMRALGYLLGLHKLTNFIPWAKERGCDFDLWGKLAFTKSAKIAKAHLEVLHDDIYPSKGVKLTRSDLAEHFRDSIVIADPLDFGDDGDIKKIYAAMEEELRALSETTKKDDPESKGSALVTQLRARQSVELLKVPAILELIEDARAEGRSVAVFLNFDASVKAVTDRLKEPYGLVVGGQKESERSDSVNKFQSGDIHIIICNMSAGGLGVSLHDERGDSPRTALISPSFNAKEIQQVKGRVDRAGAKSTSIQRILFAAGTIEERIIKQVNFKINNMETLHTAVELPTPAQEEPAHAEFSPSSLKYREIAPMYKPREGDNSASEKGTRIHYACETGDYSKLHDDEERYMAEQLINTTDHILHKVQGWAPGSYARMNEIRLIIEAADLKTFGTCDVLAVKDAEAVMMDYKTGILPIDAAEENLQAQCYVLGGFQKFPKLERIDFYFLVPARNEILYHTYRREDVARLALRVNTVIRRSKEAKECSPQFGVCEYCAFQSSCRFLAAKMLPLAQKYKEGYATPLNIDGPQARSPEELSSLLVLAKQVGKWVSAVEDHCRKVVSEDGVELPDFKRIAIQRDGGVLSPLGVLRLFENKISLEEFLACTDLSLAKLEDLIGNKAPKGQKTAEKTKVRDDLRDAGLLAEGAISYQLRQKRK